MATTSMKKDFVIKDKQAFEQLNKDLSSKQNTRRTVKSSSSLEYGEKKLKQFSFR